MGTVAKKADAKAAEQQKRQEVSRGGTGTKKPEVLKGGGVKTGAVAKKGEAKSKVRPRLAALRVGEGHKKAAKAEDRVKNNAAFADVPVSAAATMFAYCEALVRKSSDISVDELLVAARAAFPSLKVARSTILNYRAMLRRMGVKIARHTPRGKADTM